MLILAASHSIELTELLDELVHREHSRRQGLTLVVDVFRALYHLVVENLVRVDEIGHFAAKYSAV